MAKDSSKSKMTEREKLREAIAATFASFSILLVVASLSIEIYARFVGGGDSQGSITNYIREALATIVPPTIALFGSVVGFYFGRKKS